MQIQQQVQSASLWYKDAVVYEVQVRAFYDGSGDGIGDFKGLITKLDYLKDLGVTAIWLLPFYKSPLRDDGYDVSDHLAIHPELGDLRDFRKFVREAHKRKLKVVTELILNHTSSDHPWFQRARNSPPGSPWRDYYTWSDTSDKFGAARVIFNDYEPSNWTWDPVAKAYYWHRFYSHQPDLNYDNEAVQEEALRIVDFWLKLGVDGLRLDGVPYLFEREGTACESLPETHAFLKKLRSHIDSKFQDRMLLAEANQWPADAVTFFGQGDECHMAFHFPLMPRMFMALQLEDKTPITDILENTPPIPGSCQWALFLRNHDELTLEMVTDEERDYLFRAYARESGAKINLGIRRRLAPLLGNDRKAIELLKLLLFTLPGTPVIYYGDEILMGDNYNLGDRKSVRTPMQWDATMNAGFSKANPQRLYLPLVTDPEFNYETVNVENHEKNPSSHLWWLRKLIAVRKNLKALARGGFNLVDSGNPKVFAFTRSFEEETVLVAVNLSKYTQVARLDLSSFEGRAPVDIFGATQFPAIGRSSYFLTFGPHGSYVFDISPAGERKSSSVATLPEIQLRNGLPDLMKDEARETMESKVIPAYLSNNAWFKGANRSIEIVKIRDTISVPGETASRFQLMLVDVYYREGMPETYLLPIAYAGAELANEITSGLPHSEIAVVSAGDGKGMIYDGLADNEFRSSLLAMRGKSVKSKRGEIHFNLRGEDARPSEPAAQPSGPKLLGSENGCPLLVSEGLLLKLIRNPEEGVNPELEIGDFLTAKSFRGVRKTLGDITYAERGAGPLTVAILYEYAENEVDLRTLLVNDTRSFLDRVNKGSQVPRALLDLPLLELSRSKIPAKIGGGIEAQSLETMTALGRATASFHAALCDDEGKSLAPQPFGYLYQVSVSYALTTKTRRMMRRARESTGFTESVRMSLKDLANGEDGMLEKLKQFRLAKIDSVRTRVHGNYTLDRVFSGTGGLIISDCESDDSDPMDARRIMRSPLKDVVRMVRSIHHAVHTGFREAAKTSKVDVGLLEEWAYLWYKVCAATFLRGYLEAAKETKLVPSSDETLVLLFNTYLLEECVDELEASLSAQSDSVIVPIRALMELLEA